MNTNWSKPKTNFLKATMCLRKALASGLNASLVRMYNEDCEFPIVQKLVSKKLSKLSKNIDNWDSNSQTLWTLQEIEDSQHLSDDEKYMMINYVQVFGTDEAIEHYRTTDELTAENVRGVGVAHFVKRQDIIDYYKQREIGKVHLAPYYELNNNKRNFVCNFHLKPEKNRIPKKFKRKLWVVVTLKADEPKIKIPALLAIINVLLYPLKYIPQRSVLKMKEYKVITYRIGDVTNGYSVDIHKPSKFSFN